MVGRSWRGMGIWCNQFERVLVVKTFEYLLPRWKGCDIYFANAGRRRGGSKRRFQYTHGGVRSECMRSISGRCMRLRSLYHGAYIKYTSANPLKVARHCGIGTWRLHQGDRLDFFVDSP